MSERNVVEVDVGLLDKADWNYKKDDPAMMAKLQANLKRNGQIENIVIREKPGGRYEVVNGNHRLDALRAAGSAKAWAVNLGDIPDWKAKRIAIELNETRFENDELRLASMLEGMAKEMTKEEMLETMPIEPAEIDRLIAMAAFDWSQYKAQGDGIRMVRQVIVFVSPPNVETEEKVIGILRGEGLDPTVRRRDP
jgi:ParB-like chromosome segregation protein Spo0J